MALQQSLAVVADQNGKRIAFGTATPDAATFDIATGLKAVDHCLISLQGQATLDHMHVSAAPHSVAGEIRTLHKKPTAANDGAIVAATDNWVAINWIAVGD
jgi:hypothetical protein